MADYTRRLQVLLTEEQFQFLKDLSRQKRRSVGDLIRDSVDRAYRPSSSLAHLRVVGELRSASFLKGISLEDMQPGSAKRQGEGGGREG